MTDSRKLQTILDNQVEIKGDIKRLCKEVKHLDERLTETLDDLVEIAVGRRRSPTRNDFKDLQRRVFKLEQHLTKN